MLTMAPVSRPTQMKWLYPNPLNKSTFFDGVERPLKCPNFWAEPTQCHQCQKKMKMLDVKRIQTIHRRIQVKEGKEILPIFLRQIA